jgi:hypothetical protein
MNILVQLRDAYGHPLRDDRGIQIPAMSDGFEFARALPEHDDLSFPYLRLVDPYGNTMFNGYQMAAVIPELERLAESSSSRQVDRVLQMARLCQATIHSYLVFIGD